MTGQYNYRSYHGWGVFDPQKQRTFGHMLKDAGYATSLSGKWQFDNFEKTSPPRPRLRLRRILRLDLATGRQTHPALTGSHLFGRMES